METKRKNIQVVQGKINDASDDLSTLYKDLGRRLLTDSYHDVDAGRKNQFDTLMSHREEASGVINSINQSLARIQEIKTFQQEVDVHISKLNKEMLPKFELLGEKVFHYYDTRYADYFGTAYQIAQDEGKKLIDKQDTIANYEEQATSASFFNKVILKTKILALKAGLGQHNARVAKAFSEGASSLFASGLLEKDYQAGNLDSEVVNALIPCQEQQKKIDDQNARKTSLIQEESTIRASFTENGTSVNPQKKIDLIKVDLLSLDDQIDRLCEETGLTFLDARISATGEEISSDNEYSEWVLQGKLLRKNRVKLVKELAVLELEVKMDSWQKVIDSSNSSIRDNEARIKRLRDQNDSLEEKIKSANNEKEILNSKKIEIEAEIQALD